jgi:hypothetical protein
MSFMKKILVRDSRVPDSEISSSASSVRFLVQFAEADLEAFREGDWLNLQEELAAFVRSGPAGLTLRTDGPLGALRQDVESRRRVQQFQSDVGDLLQQIAAAQSTFPPEARAKKYFNPDWSGDSLNGITRFGLTTDGVARPRLALYGNFLKLAYFQAALLLLVLKDPGVARLRMCPECRTVFIRVRKQRYCTRRCVNRANMRAWTARPHGKASHRKSSREAYKKLVRARTGPRVKVGRDS